MIGKFIRLSLFTVTAFVAGLGMGTCWNQEIQEQVEKAMLEALERYGEFKQEQNGGSEDF